MSIPNRHLDAPLPAAQPAKLTAVVNRRDATSSPPAAVAIDTPAVGEARISAIDAMALCMSGGCVGG